MGVTPERLAELLDAHAAALELFAAQWTQAPADAVQEAFVELARQPELPRNIVAWLYRVVRNRALSEARARGGANGGNGPRSNEVSLGSRPGTQATLIQRKPTTHFAACPTNCARCWWPAFGVD